jgi:hypothetical protein
MLHHLSQYILSCGHPYHPIEGRSIDVWLSFCLGGIIEGACCHRQTLDKSGTRTNSEAGSCTIDCNAFKFVNNSL